MGDKGKKDKNKTRKQKIKKQERAAERALEKESIKAPANSLGTMSPKLGCRVSLWSPSDIVISRNERLTTQSLNRALGAIYPSIAEAVPRVAASLH